jgi:hypothetical protein
MLADSRGFGSYNKEHPKISEEINEVWIHTFLQKLTFYNKISNVLHVKV